MLTRDLQPCPQPGGSKRAESGTRSGRWDQETRAPVAGKESRPAWQDACEDGSQPPGRVERKITSLCPGRTKRTSRRRAGKGDISRANAEPWLAGLRTRRGGAPAIPDHAEPVGAWFCLAVSGPGLRGGQDAALLHPPFASVACGPPASFPHSAPQIPGAPETEDLDLRPERRPQGTTPHCVARSRPLSPFAPSQAPDPG